MRNSANRYLPEILMSAGYAIWAARWLVTSSNHPSASTFQYAWAWGQLGVGLYFWVHFDRKAKGAAKSSDASAS